MDFKNNNSKFSFLGIVSLILGLISFIILISQVFYGFLSLISLLLLLMIAVITIILGILGASEKTNRKIFGRIGIFLGISVVISIIAIYIFGLWFISTFSF